MYLGYSASVNPGDGVTNVEMPADAAKVMMLAFDVSKLAVVNSVNESQTLDAAISIMPNPAHDVATIRIKTVTAGRVTVSIHSTLGETVMTSQSPDQSGTFDLVVATQNLSAGTYHCIVEQHGARTVVPLVVVR